MFSPHWFASAVPNPFNTPPPAGSNFAGTQGFLNQISGTLTIILGTLSLLGIVAGALLFTTVGWSQESKQIGHTVLRVSTAVLVVTIMAETFVQMLLHLSG
jgi:hypothetical protein